MPLGLTAYCTLGKIFRWIEGKGQISYARKRWLTACDAACRRTYRPRGSILGPASGRRRSDRTPLTGRKSRTVVKTHSGRREADPTDLNFLCRDW